MPTLTKRDLERQIEDLKSQVRAMRNELSELHPHSTLEYIPCGPITEVFGHAFENEIRNAVCEQYNGSTGWIVIHFDRYDFPFVRLLCNVSYSAADGTFVSKFCQLAKRTRQYDYDKNCWEDWKAENGSSQ